MNEGIILRKIDFEETSFIITVLTENKYESLMVKGAKRKNSLKLSISEPLTLIEYEKTKSTKMATLIEGTAKNTFNNIKSDLIKLSISSVILEYAYLVKDIIINPKDIYNLLKDSLEEIENETIDTELILFRFELILLKYLGSQVQKEYLKQNYLLDEPTINTIEKIIKGETDIDRIAFRHFIKDYYNKECGINLKSKKLYLDII